MSRRRRRPPNTIFSPHNVDQVKRFFKQALRVESLLEKEIERIAKDETAADEKREAAKLELIKRHRGTIEKLASARLDLASMMQSIGVNLHG